MSNQDPGDGFPNAEDLGGDRMGASYDPNTGGYHYTVVDTDQNVRVSWDTDNQGNYTGGLHMVDQDTGDKFQADDE